MAKVKVRISHAENYVIEPSVFVELGKTNSIFPLFSMQDMAKRWGKSIQTVKNWEDRYEDVFPNKLPGVCEDGKSRPVYPLYEVLRFESEKSDLLVAGKKASVVVVDDPQA